MIVIILDCNYNNIYLALILFNTKSETRSKSNASLTCIYHLHNWKFSGRTYAGGGLDSLFLKYLIVNDPRMRCCGLRCLSKSSCCRNLVFSIAKKKIQRDLFYLRVSDIRGVCVSDTHIIAYLLH